MVGYQIKDGFIDFANIDFKCPYCEKEYSDSDDKYLNRCNNNKNFTTKIKCDCGKTFGVTYDYKGDMVSFFNKTQKI